ncbi:MAG: ribonuclease D [Gammaproteobacteria bacterium]|nr:ribonuclease D [Gammaproteobacteria bacterium]
MAEILYIDSNAKLAQLCLSYHSKSQNNSPYYLFLDTEFIRQTTYYPKLALIQITDGEQLAIIDPLAIDDLNPFYKLCFNTDITKVFHSGSQDLEIFYYLWGELPRPIFDTQIAAAVLGYGQQIGYANLVHDLLHIELDKSQTRTNWLKRPLTPAQITYAANDVIYLEKIFHQLLSQLNELNRLHWLDEDFRQQSLTSTYCIKLDEIWRKVKGFQRLRQNQLVYLQALAKMREEFAIKKDRVRKHIISDDNLLKLARSQPRNHQQLINCDLPEKQANALGEHIINNIKLSDKITIDKHPELPKKHILNNQQEAICECLMALCQLSAKEHNISTSFLCQRKELEKLVIHKDNIEQSNSSLLNGWRHELLGNQVKMFLSGKAQLTIKDGLLGLENG